jgi:hypothetical protein
MERLLSPATFGIRAAGSRKRRVLQRVFIPSTHPNVCRFRSRRLVNRKPVL